MQSDIRVVSIGIQFAEEPFRVPLMFGTGVIRTITSLTADVTVENRRGNRAHGRGNILLSDIWGFPSPVLSHEQRDEAMRNVSTAYAQHIEGYGRYAHPITIYMEAREDLKRIAHEWSHRLGLGEEMPVLGALVCASPIDAAIHDAFGHVNGINSYDGYGSEYMEYDLSSFLGKRYRGRYVSDYIRKDYTPSLPIFHLVGGMDKLKRQEVDDTDPKDGLPVSLEEWIERDGVFCFKIKLKGNDMVWDLARIKSVTEVVQTSMSRTNRETKEESAFWFSLDTNEQCEHPDYLVELLDALEKDIPEAFQAILYVEQPTERNLADHRFDMRRLAAIKPVLADEGITDIDQFDLAVELGWSGIALKTCKGHSSALLYVCKAIEEGLAYTVQDLTNPGRSFIHSAGFAARINPMKGVEYNSRQYIPWANQAQMSPHATLFTVRKGRIRTESIQDYGLGYS